MHIYIQPPVEDTSPNADLKKIFYLKTQFINFSLLSLLEFLYSLYAKMLYTEDGKNNQLEN